MSGLLGLLLANALAAGLLALGAWALSRRIRRQTLVHGLWMLALVKLVTPPVLPLPLLPEWEVPDLTLPASPTTVVIEADSPPPLAPRGPGAALEPEARPLPGRLAADPGAEKAQVPPATATAGLQSPPSPEETKAAAPGQTLSSLAWLGLLAGGLAVALLAAVRVRRFRRLLRLASAAPPDLERRVAELASRVGLPRAPTLRLLPAPVPPMLWPGRGGPLLLMPSALLPTLTEEECDTLLVHELAHVRRRDHWVRLLELAVTILFWWYPVAWWVRSALRRAEERCCDEWVLRVMPDSAPAYARGLLKSLDLLADETHPLPVGASGAGPVRDLETRLKEIVMTTRPMPRLTTPARLGLALAALLGLAVFPTQAQPPASEEESAPEVAVPSAHAQDPVAAAPEPVVAAPSPEPVVAAPAPEPVVAAPAPEPVVAAPAPEPVVAAPSPEPVVAAPSPGPVAPAPGPDPIVAAPAAPAPVEAVREVAPLPDVAVAAVPPVPAPPSVLGPVVAPAPAPRPLAAPAPAVLPRPAPAPVLAPAPLDESPEDDAARREMAEQHRRVQAERAELHRQELTLARERMSREAAEQQKKLQLEAARLRAAGETDGAERLELQARARAERMEIRRREVDLELARMAEQSEIEHALQARAEELRALEREGRGDEAEALRAELARLEQEHVRRHLDHEEKQIALQREALEVEQRARETEVQIEQEMAFDRQADLEAEMEDQRQRMELEHTLQEQELELHEREAAIREKEREAMERESAGEHEAAEAARAEAEGMREDVEISRRRLHEERLLRATGDLEQQMRHQLEALRQIQAEGADDQGEVAQEIGRLEAALAALQR